MTLETYTSRCKKLHLKLSNLPTCSDGWNRGVAHCAKVWGPCYLSPLSGRDSLVPLELACKWDTYLVAFIVTWNLYQMKYLYIKQIPVETYIRLNITSNMYQIWHILQSCTRLFLNTNKTMLKLIPDMTYTSIL